ncbi:hypothetical protein QUW23_04040 [Parasutterella secunda]|uniref:hypothetical protein n=1 Tax=Parasutterella secunda TaxID=626947 RepID=UPI0025A49B7A|nr:hypothetical protein [Parasutterella secunda]MDM8225221.1 hypothetical protein [Parasutterella secunda]
MPALPRWSVISAALICAVMLSGCSEESKMIDLVKNSRSQLDGLEMGPMLENTKVCSKPKWSYQETKRGEQYILFECTPNADLSVISKKVKSLNDQSQNECLASIKRYEESIAKYQKEVDTISGKLQELNAKFEAFKKTDFTNSMPIFYYTRMEGGQNKILFILTLFNLSPDQWNYVFQNVKNYRYDYRKLFDYVQELRKTTSIYAMSVTSSWDSEEIEAYETLFDLPKDQCFDAWKNQVLPKMEQYRFVKRALRLTSRELTANFEKAIDRYKWDLEKTLREVEKFNRYLEREKKNLANLKNINWTQLKDATLYVKFNVVPEKEQIIKPHGSRSGYVLRWEDGTEINQYGFYTMVQMNLERAAEQDDERSLQYWIEGLSNPMTLKTFYQQGTRSK